MIRSVLVLGGGSAGLLAALTLKRKLPDLDIEVVFSSRIGVIGVGEGTVPYVPHHLHAYLGFDEHEVFTALRPVFKLGVRFQWGKRSGFDYTFSGRQHSWRTPELPRNNGFYGFDDPAAMDLPSALMDRGKALPRRADGLPDLPPAGTNLAWHLENRLFVDWLESACRRCGVRFTDAELAGVETGEAGISAIRLNDGSERRADFHIDSTGFASELVGKALGEPFEDFSGSLFCDRAVAGGWERDDEPVLPYTLSETMEAGWCWRSITPTASTAAMSIRAATPRTSRRSRPTARWHRKRRIRASCASGPGTTGAAGSATWPGWEMPPDSSSRSRPRR